LSIKTRIAATPPVARPLSRYYLGTTIGHPTPLRRLGSRRAPLGFGASSPGLPVAGPPFCRQRDISAQQRWLPTTTTIARCGGGGPGVVGGGGGGVGGWGGCDPIFRTPYGKLHRPRALSCLLIYFVVFCLTRFSLDRADTRFAFLKRFSLKLAVGIPRFLKHGRLIPTPCRTPTAPVVPPAGQPFFSRRVHSATAAVAPVPKRARLSPFGRNFRVLLQLQLLAIALAWRPNYAFLVANDWAERF